MKYIEDQNKPAETLIQEVFKQINDKKKYLWAYIGYIFYCQYNNQQ